MEAIIYLFIINLLKIGRHTQKAKPVQGVCLQKTNIHTPTTTPNNTQPIQATKTSSYLISLHISDHKGDVGKNFYCCSQGCVSI